MGFENPVHILFVAAVALIVLGPRRLPELTRAAGRSIREFREALQGGGAEGRGAAGVGAERASAEVQEGPPDRVRSPNAPDRGPV